MKPTQTGIAVALALIVVIVVLIFPGLSPFGSLDPTEQATTGNDLFANEGSMAENITELQVTDTVEGTGDAAERGDTVTVQYVGTLPDGTEFDASANHGTSGFTFTLGAGQVIQGWDEGLVGMKVGGKRTLLIPADMAYGDRAVGNVIPANSPLVFEVELVSVEKGQ